jgi:hypothetical protein
MADEGQISKGELTPDQLEIGKAYRIEAYGRLRHGAPHKLINTSLARFKERWREEYDTSFMKFKIVAPGTGPWRSGQDILIDSDTNPRDNYHYRFFQSTEDRLVAPLRQEALQKLLSKMVDPVTAYGLSNGWFAPSKKSGGRKYKTRQNKLRRKNRTRKNRRRR